MARDEETGTSRRDFILAGAALAGAAAAGADERPTAGRDATDADLDRLQRQTFDYFVHEVDPANGLTRDHAGAGVPCSIAAVGLGLAAYAVGVDRGWMTREEAAGRTLQTLRTFADGPHGPEPDATGYKGFYYHFLDTRTARRAMKSELSTIDTTFLLAGALAAGAYFDGATEAERTIRTLSDCLYRRADWQWALNGGRTVSHGWTPEGGFIPSRWEGYNEALLLYVLGLAAPDHPLPADSYPAWARTYEWKELYGHAHLYAGPLFIHQLSHVWVDFRGIRDEFMRGHDLDYFENSRRATLVQREYAIRNPRGFAGYGPDCWGVTASDGPGPTKRRAGGVDREFFGYLARSVPDGPDDGTISPWAAVASLPFAPEVVRPAIRYMLERYPDATHEYGFRCCFNPTFTAGYGPQGWVSQNCYGIDQGPILLMLENHRTGFLWDLMRRCPHVRTGLLRAGFSGGWLE